MADLLPIVKLSDSRTCKPWRSVPVCGVIVRLKDIIEYPYLLKKIDCSGSIHDYLGFYGDVYLSSIMNNKLIKKTSLKRYYDIIELLKPDYYFTTDTETYEQEDSVSFKNIDRILADTEKLIGMSKSSKPIGLVKGSNPAQITYHACSLREIGICRLVFHNGDFVYRASKREKSTAKHYAEIVRQYADELYIYGIGPGSFERFSFADHYATQSHLVSSFNGKVYDKNGWRFSTLDIENRIIENIISMESKLDYINKTVRRLDLWAAEAEAEGVAAEAVVPRPVMVKTR